MVFNRSTLTMPGGCRLWLPALCAAVIAVVSVAESGVGSRFRLQHAGAVTLWQACVLTERAAHSATQCALLCQSEEECSYFTFGSLCQTYYSEPGLANAGSFHLIYAKTPQHHANHTQCNVTVFTDCFEIKTCFPDLPSGEYSIHVQGAPQRTNVFCDMSLDGGGWTVFQKRVDGSEEFQRSWTDYRQGFGSLSEEFWLGNDILHLMTSQHDQMLRVNMRDFDGNILNITYDSFWINGVTDNFRLQVSGCSTPELDSLSLQSGSKFSTKDRDNDNWDDGECAVETEPGAWWFDMCSYSHLNGPYMDSGMANYSAGIYWAGWGGFYNSFKAVSMAIKPLTADEDEVTE